MDPTSSAPTRAFALYCRLSHNPNGTKDSVATQLAVGREWAAKRWPGRPVLVFSDDDLSADDDTYRPGYEAMLSAIEAGEVGDVLCRVQARISRGKVVWPRFQMTCLAAGVLKLTTWESGEVSLVEGEDMAGDIINLFNVHHRVTTKLSVVETLGKRATDGRPAGGRPYGYKHKRDANGVSHLVIVEEQQDVILRMAAWVLAGWSLASVARQLNAEGIKTKHGKDWTTGRVKIVLTNPVVTGLRVYKGDVVGEGNWTPILDRSIHDALKAALNQPRTVTTNGHDRIIKGTRRPGRRHLLTGGPAVCGECDMSLVAQMKTRSGDGVREAVYYCTSAKGGCGKVWVNGERLEALVVERFLDWVATPAYLAAMGAEDADVSERERIKVDRDALKQRRKDTGAQAATGKISPELAGIIEQGIIEEERKLDRRLAELGPLSPALSMSGEDIVEAWAGMTLEERRAVMFTVSTRVVVGRAAKRRWSFEEDRVDVLFGYGVKATAARRRAKPRRKAATTKAKSSGGKSSTDGSA